MSKFTTFVKTAKRVAENNSSAILAGVAIAGVVTTGVLAYKAAPKAQAIIERHRENMEDIETKPERNKEVMETIKELAPVLAPPVIMGAATIGCIVGGHSVNRRRIAALSAAYEISQTALEQFESKAIEQIGGEAVQEIKKKVIEEKVNPETVRNAIEQGAIIETGHGSKLFYDSFGGRYFRCEGNYLKKIAHTINNRVLTEDSATINDFFYELGLPMVKHGNSFGWTAGKYIDVDHMFIDWNEYEDTCEGYGTLDLGEVVIWTGR